jgi:hypothetical protein
MKMMLELQLFSVISVGVLGHAATGQTVLTTQGSNVFVLDRGSNPLDLRSWMPPKDLGLVRDLVAGGCQAVAILHDGSLRAWGPSGQVVPADVGPVRSVFATWQSTPSCYGYGEIFAVEESGEVRKWTPGSNTSVLFVPNGMGPIKKLGGYGGPSVALRKDGTVWSTIAAQPDDIRGCIDVASKGDAAMAVLADGSVRVWGSDYCQGWFPGADPNDCNASLTATIVGPEAIVAVKSGDYGFATIDSSGRVVRYGRNYFSSCPCPPVVQDWQPPTQCDNEQQYLDVSLRAFQPFYGDFHGLMDDGRVWFGYGDYTCAPDDYFRIEGIGPETILPVAWRVYLGLYSATADVDGDGIADDVDNCMSVANSSQENADRDRYGDACDLAVIDCDQDNVEDALAIASGSVTDVNTNGVPDLCDCLGNVNDDRVVDGADIGAVLSGWGSAPADTRLDPNRDGAVDGADLGILLSQWGPCSN